MLLPSRTSCGGMRLSECWHGLLRPPHHERPGLARAGGAGSFIFDTGACACTRSCAGTPVFIYTGLSAHCCVATLSECGISVTSLAIVTTYVMLSVLFFLVHPPCSCAPESSLGPAGGRPARGVPKGWTPSKGQGTSLRPRSGEGWGCHRKPRVWLGGKVRDCGVWDSAYLCLMPPGPCALSSALASHRVR